MSFELELPARLHGHFSIYLYWQSHGLLLLRSVDRANSPKRIEVLFKDTLWMSLPAWANGLEIGVSKVQPLLQQLPTSLHDEALLRRAFRLHSEEVDYHVIAGSVWISQDDQEYFADSALLPDIRIVNEWPKN